MALDRLRAGRLSLTCADCPILLTVGSPPSRVVYLLIASGLIETGIIVRNRHESVEKASRFVHNFWGRVYPGWSMEDSVRPYVSCGLRPARHFESESGGILD